MKTRETLFLQAPDVTMATDKAKRKSRGSRGSSSSDEPAFTVYIKTGDRPKAGTDANVHIVLHGEDGNHTDATKLDLLFHNDFERGQLDKYRIKNVQFTTVESVEIWRDSTGIGDEWFIDTIFVENNETLEKVPFPVFRWIRSDYRYKLLPYDTTLPQYDTRKDQRRLDLQEKRDEYQFEPKAPGMPAQVRSLPKDEAFSFDYTWDIAWTKTKLGLTKKLIMFTTGKWNSVEDVKSLYNIKAFDTPSDLDRWSDDVKFGLQRVAGVNNTQLRLCTKIPDNLAVTGEMIEPFLEGKALETALQDKKMFLVDYKLLEGCPTADGFVTCAPLGLFFERGDGNLVPVAIQLFQEPAADNPVFLPSDPKWTWIMAKMWFNNADSSIHQSITHLGFTHLLMEGVVVSVNRQLSQSHPVYKLLAPHFLYLIAINSRALEKLLSPDGYIDKTMTIAAKGVLETVTRAKSTWRMDVEGTLPADLKERGVDDLNILPNYHSRNDALILYDAIKRYVTDYVNVYYTTEEEILGDEEIQAWRDEMVKAEEDGGLDLKGVPGDGCKFTSHEHLVTVLTCIIYTCSVGHAMANFKQFDEYAFPPNYPSKLSGTPPKDKTPLTEKHIVDSLISKDDALSVMIVTTVLSKRATQPLGDFEVNYVFDPKAVKTVEKFRNDLKQIGETIRARNKARPIPYPYLDPDEIPNAISI